MAHQSSPYRKYEPIPLDPVELSTETTTLPEPPPRPLPEALRDLPDFAQELASTRAPRAAMCAIAAHHATGGRDSRPTAPITDPRAALLHDFISVMLMGNLYEDTLTPTRSYDSFSVTLYCHDAQLSGFRTNWQTNSRVFSQRLPDKEHDGILANVAEVSRASMPEMFGYLRYSTRPDGTICILEIHNDYFDHLPDALQNQYRDWEVQLLDAFIQYVSRTADLTDIWSEPDEVAQFNEQVIRTIVIPPVSVMIDRHQNQSPNESDPDGERSGDNGPQLSDTDLTQIVDRYLTAPNRCGFQQQTVTILRQGQSDELPSLTEGLVMEVPSPRESRTPTSNPRVRELLDLIPTLEAEVPQNVTIERPSAVPRVRPNCVTLFPAFEMAPAVNVPLESVLAPSLQENTALFSQHSRTVEELLNALLPPDFTPISRGYAGGMPRDWAAIPSPELPPGNYFYPAQPPHQNRHPSFRLVTVDEAGNQRRYVVGIKGAGIATIGNWEIHEPKDGARAPIYRTSNYEPGVTGAEWWGGLTLHEAREEVSQTAILFAHVAEHLPNLIDRIPVPLRMSLPTMLPTWRERETTWYLPDEYQREVLADPELVPEFVTLVTAIPSDVRIHTLVDRIFNGNQGAATDRESRLRDITRVMKFFYHEHGFTLVEPPLDAVPADRPLSPSAICAFLRDISELNREQANTIYQRICADTLAIIESIHVRGGHLGGGRIDLKSNDWVGASNGEVTAMRNIDLRGGLHDINGFCFFPWQLLREAFPSQNANYIYANPFFLQPLQKLDLLYFAETEQAIRLVLYGASYNEADHWETHQLLGVNTITLYSGDPMSERILEARSKIMNDEPPDNLWNMLRSGSQR